MTLSTQTSKASFSGNGVTTVFPLPFPFARDADIRALLLEGGVETELALGAHYTLSGAGGSSGGSLTMLAPPATGRTLVIWRAPAIVQEVDYVENSAFPAETHEAALDLLTMICQSLQEQLGRAVLYPVSTPAEDIMDSAEFLGLVTSGRDAAQSAQAGAEAAQAGAQAAGAAAQGQAASAAQSAVSAAQSALEAAQTAASGMPDASLSVKGKIQLASAAEASAGTDALKAVTPAALKPALDAKLDASGALAAIGAATSGANSDITSLSGLTTPLSVAQGGTGASSAAAARAALGIQNSGDALAVMNTLYVWRTHSKASGPVPYGYVFPLLSDELATKTNAAFDATGKYYANAGAVAVAASESSSTGTFTWYTDADDLWDGDTAQCFYTAASGAALVLDFGAGVTKALTKWTMTHYNGGSYIPHSTSWTGAGGHRYWRLRFTAAMNNGSGTVAWIVEHSDDGTSWTAASSAVSYTENSQVVSCAIEAQGDMTLIPAAVTTAAHPSSIAVRFLHKSVDAITYNTDLKVRVSTDGGSNWSEYGSIAKLCAYDADYDLLEATFDTSGLTGTSLKAEVSTYNTKSQRVAGIALGHAA